MVKSLCGRAGALLLASKRSLPLSDKSAEAIRRAQRRMARLYPPKPKRSGAPRGEKRAADMISGAAARPRATPGGRTRRAASGVRAKMLPLKLLDFLPHFRTGHSFP